MAKKMREKRKNNQGEKIVGSESTDYAESSTYLYKE